MGSLFVVGIGPGNISNMTAHAVAVIGICDVICGYDKYVDLLGEMTKEKMVVTTGMTKETDRCREAIRLASAGHNVALVCSGDAGVYGMAGLVYELAKEAVPIEIVPGITAATSGAALLGAPLMNDFAVLSLSDRLTPWEKIEKRLAGIAALDMVMVLYNPMSKHRPDNLKAACDIILKYRPADTLCGWVKNVGREGQKHMITTLGELRDMALDMFCTVFIGASETKSIDGKMVTARGYEL